MLPTKLTVTEIKIQHGTEWFACSKQQQIFLLEYISGGIITGEYDAESAARLAYPNVKEIGIWANRLLVNKKVSRIVALHQGLSEAEVLLADVRSLITKSRRAGAPWMKVAAALEALVAKEKS
jgi:hypothetical protein